MSRNRNPDGTIRSAVTRLSMPISALEIALERLTAIQFRFYLGLLCKHSRTHHDREWARYSFPLMRCSQGSAEVILRELQEIGLVEYQILARRKVALPTYLPNLPTFLGGDEQTSHPDVAQIKTSSDAQDRFGGDAGFLDNGGSEGTVHELGSVWLPPITENEDPKSPLAIGRRNMQKAFLRSLVTEGRTDA